MNKHRLVLLDVHAILHRAYHALPEFSNSSGSPTGALYGLSTMLIRIIAELKPDFLVACYDLPKPTFRKDVYADYKGGRAKTADDLIEQIKKSPEIFQAFNIPTYSFEGFEADDILGTICEQMKKNREVEIVIASGDMDTLQLVKDGQVRVWTLKKGLNDTISYDETAVQARFGFAPKLLPDYKGLRGDPSDNIIGVTGIGEKTATELIQGFGSIEEIYKTLKKHREQFLQAGFKERIVKLLEDNEEEAKFSKMLATIRRDAPIIFTLPEKKWRDNFDFQPIEELWRVLEFRNLIGRLKTALNGETIKKIKNIEVANELNGQASLLGEEELKQEIKFDTSNPLYQAIAIGLWVLNSNLTSPQASDLWSFGQSQDLTLLQQKLHLELKAKQLDFVYEQIELAIIPMVAEMTKNGIKIDQNYLQKLSAEYHQVLTKLEREIWDLAGLEFNISSPKQLGEILFEKMGLAGKRQKKTATGNFSTKESELEKLKGSHPIFAKLLEYRELEKLLNTYIDNLPTLLKADGKIHAIFDQAGTRTGRFSSSQPNLQNIPTRSELGRKIRGAFVADDGYELVSFDYSQIELRIAAFLSGDQKMIEIFEQDKDIHRAVAAQVFAIPENEVDKEQRNRAKTINFGIIYGMGINALKSELGTTREEAQQFYNDYFAAFPQLTNYLEQVKQEANRDGYIKTLFGRRRYFEGIKSKIPYIRAAAERMAINAPIQGTEADIIKLAMREIWQWIIEQNLQQEVKILLQVHDELVFEIKQDKLAEASKNIKAKMEGVMELYSKFNLTYSGIVCRVNYKRGQNWLEMY